MKVARGKIIAALFLAATSAGVYLNSVNDSFHWDDETLVKNNIHIRTLKNIPVFFNPGYINLYEMGRGQRYRPVRSISFALDHYIWGASPRGYHLTNVLLHAAATLCVYKLFLTIMPAFPAASFVGALVFAVHPVHVESVAYVKNRSDIISAIFYVCAIIMFIKWRTAASGRRRAYYVSSLAAFVCALLSKEMSVTLPFVLAAATLSSGDGAALPDAGVAARRRDLAATAPFFAALACYFAFRKFMMKSPRDVFPGGLKEHSIFVLNTVGDYLRTLFYPVKLVAERVPSQDFSFVSAAIIVAAVAALVFLYRAKMTAAAFWLFFILMALAPISNIAYIAGRPFGEQRLYIPSIGFAGFFGAAAEYVGAKVARRPAVYSFAALVVALFAVRTILRNNDWRDEITLWSRTVAVRPTPRARHNLGVAFSNAGRYAESLEILETLRTDEPGYADNYNTLGYLYYKLGLNKKSIEAYEKGLSLAESGTEMMANLAALYGFSGQKEKAEALFKKALAAAPWSWRVCHNYGVYLRKQGKTGEAENLLNESISLNPYNVSAYLELAEIMTEKYDLASARALYTRALELDPRNADAMRYFSKNK